MLFFHLLLIFSLSPGNICDVVILVHSSWSVIAFAWTIYHDSDYFDTLFFQSIDPTAHTYEYLVTMPIRTRSFSGRLLRRVRSKAKLETPPEPVPELPVRFLLAPGCPRYCPSF